MTKMICMCKDWYLHMACSSATKSSVYFQLDVLSKLGVQYEYRYGVCMDYGHMCLTSCYDLVRCARNRMPVCSFCTCLGFIPTQHKLNSQ